MDFLSGNIYASDGFDGVFVYDNDGRYLYDFGEEFRVKMDGPRCMVISGNRVFITQFRSYCVLIYSLDGNFITQFECASICSNEIHDYTPALCFAVSEMNGDIYACDTHHHIVLVVVFYHGCGTDFTGSLFNIS